jgi:nitroimidazol reductase NimA-like FMN-containing flavoprotein (pyridoxamine 5'-phosphate oxidase superfamily)
VTDQVSPAAGRAIVDANAFMTIATADADGTPWATPVWFSHRAYAELVWVSRPGARHSRNIAARPEVGIVVFDSTVVPGEGRAVYAEARAGEVPAEALDDLLSVYAERSVAQGLRVWTIDDVTGDAPHRLFVARTTAAYVLDERDRRQPVEL